MGIPRQTSLLNNAKFSRARQTCCETEKELSVGLWPNDQTILSGSSEVISASLINTTFLETSLWFVMQEV